MVATKVNLVQGGFNISVENADQVLKAIRTIAPDLDKELKKQLRGIGNQIVRGAKQRVPGVSPLSNWERIPVGDPNWWAKFKADERGLRRREGGFPAYNAGTIKSNIRTGVGKPRGAKYGGIVYVSNKDAAGSILEVAGRKNAPFNAAGEHFIKVMNDVDTASRVIWDAFDDLGRTRIQQEIVDAVEAAEQELQRRLGGDGFVETRR